MPRFEFKMPIVVWVFGDTEKEAREAATIATGNWDSWEVDDSLTTGEVTNALTLVSRTEV